jgi:hypothetical protein
MNMRTIREIALEVKQLWAKPNYAAGPYLDAMLQLETVNDMYYADSARTIVSYFLANAGTFRGDDAKRIKAELKAMVA